MSKKNYTQSMRYKTHTRSNASQCEVHRQLTPRKLSIDNQAEHLKKRIRILELKIKACDNPYRLWSLKRHLAMSIDKFVMLGVAYK